jgi:hypothetical protein
MQSAGSETGYWPGSLRIPGYEIATSEQLKEGGSQLSFRTLSTRWPA